MWSDDEIRNAYTYHPPSEEGVKRHRRLSELFIELTKELREILPPGREAALVKTKLEEAKMHASAAVARNPETR